MLVYVREGNVWRYLDSYGGKIWSKAAQTVAKKATAVLRPES